MCIKKKSILLTPFTNIRLLLIHSYPFNSSVLRLRQNIITRDEKQVVFPPPGSESGRFSRSDNSQAHQENQTMKRAIAASHVRLIS